MSEPTPTSASNRHRRPDPHAPLRREARLLYKERVKPALKSGLLKIKRQAQLDADDYVVHVADNLLPGLVAADIEQEFKAGAGGELKGKMRAPWSSSALAVNAFLPWRIHGDTVPLLEIGSFPPMFAFEAKCPNKVSRTPPHLDVLFKRDRDVVGVESKSASSSRAVRIRRSPRAISRLPIAATRAPRRAGSRRW